MSLVADSPFSEVRARQAKEHANHPTHRDACKCGLPFQYVAIDQKGERHFFWCTRCDVTRGARYHYED